MRRVRVALWDATGTRHTLPSSPSSDNGLAASNCARRAGASSEGSGEDISPRGGRGGTYCAHPYPLHLQSHGSPGTHSRGDVRQGYQLAPARFRLAAVAIGSTAAAPPCRLTDSAAWANVMLVIPRIAHSPKSEFGVFSDPSLAVSPAKDGRASRALHHPLHSGEQRVPGTSAWLKTLPARRLAGAHKHGVTYS